MPTHTSGWLGAARTPAWGGGIRHGGARPRHGGGGGDSPSGRGTRPEIVPTGPPAPMIAYCPFPTALFLPSSDAASHLVSSACVPVDARCASRPYLFAQPGGWRTPVERATTVTLSALRPGAEQRWRGQKGRELLKNAMQKKRKGGPREDESPSHSFHHDHQRAPSDLGDSPSSIHASSRPSCPIHCRP